MILPCVGLPGRFNRWCGEVAAGLAEAAGYRAAICVWPTDPEIFGFEPPAPVTEEIARQFIVTAPEVLVAVVRQPDERLLSMLASSGTRFVVALDDPRVAAAELLDATGAEVGLVTRAVANACPLLTRFAELPGALALTADRARGDPGVAIAAIGNHFALPATKARSARSRKTLATSEHIGGAAPSTGETEARVIDDALAGYADQFGGGNLGRLVWRRELFVLYADGFQRPTGFVDLSGPPRPLVYGPYIQLAPGQWSARVFLGLSPEAAGNTFLVDAFADLEQLGHAIVTPVKGGVYAADIEFSLSRPSSKGVEIRTLALSENARGRMAFGHVVLHPAAASGQPALPEDWQDVETLLNR